MPRNWDDDFYDDVEFTPKKVRKGYCINCPEASCIKATHKYNQLEPMCEYHFNLVMDSLETILHTKYNREKYRL